MTSHSKTASTSGIVEAAVVSKAVGASNYQTRPSCSTTNYAVAKVAARFRLSLCTSREVCRLAGIGGAQ